MIKQAELVPCGSSHICKPLLIAAITYAKHCCWPRPPCSHQIPPPLLIHTSVFAPRILFDNCVCVSVCVFLQIVVCNSLSFVLAEGLSQLCHQQPRQGAGVEQGLVRHDICGGTTVGKYICVCVSVGVRWCVFVRVHMGMIGCLWPLDHSPTHRGPKTSHECLSRIPSTLRATSISVSTEFKKIHEFQKHKLLFGFKCFCVLLISEDVEIGWEINMAF